MGDLDGNERVRIGEALHYGSKQYDFETSKFLFSHELGSKRSEGAREQMRAAECVSKGSNGKQANE